MKKRFLVSVLLLFLLISLFSISAQSSPIFYVNFDDNFNDQSGNYVTSWNVSSYSSGKLGNAGVFSNSNPSFLTTSKQNDLGGMSALTISVWAKKATSSEQEIIIDKHVVYMIQVRSNGLQYYVNNQSSQIRETLTVANSDTNWHHYALTYDGNNVNVYFDGNNIRNKSFSGVLASNIYNKFMVAKDPWGETFNGQLDDLKIYDIALTNQQILDEYNRAQFTPPEPIPPVVNNHENQTKSEENVISLDCKEINTLCVDDTQGKTQEYSTIQACADVVSGGQTCLIYPGIYNETVNIKKSGTLTQPITFKSVNLKEAVVDGSDILIASWIKCSSALECGNNPNYENIYYTTLPIISTIFTPLYQNDKFMWLGQTPNPNDFFNFDNIDYFKKIPLNDKSIKITDISLTDPSIFNQQDANYWKGAWLAIWRDPNVVEYVEITSYNPSTNTVTFDLEGSVYTDRESYYAVLNHISTMDSPGEMVYDNNAGRLYIYPYLDPLTSEFTIGKRVYGFNTNGNSNIVIDGFKVQKQYSHINWWTQGTGITVSNTGSKTTNLIVKNNEVTKIKSMVGAAAINIRGEDNIAENNYVHDNQRSRGIEGGGNKIKISNNVIENCGGTGIWILNTNNSIMFNNTLFGIKGVHSNAFSIYEYSNNILVVNNKVFDSNIGGTFQRSKNVFVYNNLFDSDNAGVFSWNDMDGFYLFNNLFMQGLLIGSRDKNVIIKNNIISKGGVNSTKGVTSNNIYTGLDWWQKGSYGWSLQTGEFTEFDSSKIFVDILNKNYHLKNTSVALDKGADISSYLPKTYFSSFNFNQDLDGITRPNGLQDIGPYEYLEGQQIKDIPSTQTNTGNQAITVRQESGGGSKESKGCSGENCFDSYADKEKLKKINLSELDAKQENKLISKEINSSLSKLLVISITVVLIIAGFFVLIVFLKKRNG